MANHVTYTDGSDIYYDNSGNTIFTLDWANSKVTEQDGYTSETSSVPVTVAQAGVVRVADNITLTLPAAATSSGVRFRFKAYATFSGGVVIKGNGAELIDGANTKTSTAQYNSITVYCNGTGWDILNKVGTWN